MDSDWKVTSKRTVLKNGKFCTVEYHTIELPDGRIIDDWTWIVTPDFVNAVVVDRAGQFIMLRQSKYGIDGDSLAPVGGFMEEGEDPLEAVQRETMEELGYQAARWIPLGAYRADSNRGCGTGHMFLALDAEKVRGPDADDLEKQEIALFEQRDVEEELLNGGIKVMPWAQNIALALLYLHNEGPELRQ